MLLKSYSKRGRQLKLSSNGVQNIFLPSSAKWSFVACYPEGGLIRHLVRKKFHYKAYCSPDGELYIQAVREIKENEEVRVFHEEEYWCDSRWPSSLLSSQME
jgi:hypothetical protein